MRIWSKINPWLDRDYYAFTSITILLSIVTLSYFFTKDKIRSENDLTKIEGKYNSYSFKKGNRGTLMYYFWLNEYKCTFQIPANYISYFNRNRFIANVKKNDKLNIYISNNQVTNLNSKEKIFVQHIGKQNLIFLNKMNSIKTEKSYSEVYFSIIIFIAGILYYVIRKTIWKPKE
jgi:hypothetical protein